MLAAEDTNTCTKEWALLTKLTWTLGMLLVVVHFTCTVCPSTMGLETDVTDVTTKERTGSMVNAPDSAATLEATSDTSTV